MLFAQEYNDFDQEWAVFFLRHVNLKVPEYFGYLGAELYEPLMQRAKSTSEPAAFVLVNERIEGAVWKNQRFSLLELGSQPILIGVQAPSGLEHVNGKPFVWLGNNATRFLIVSKIAQTATFSAGECLTGPSRPEDKDRQIRISTDLYRKRAEHHATAQTKLRAELAPFLEFKREAGYFPGCGGAQVFLETECERAEWHAHLKAKYQRASFRPWLQVEPDPAEPE